MRLRRVLPYGPGFRRVRRGRGFSYLCADGERVADEAVIERITKLVIPPAWQQVWICEAPNGHIQAVGVDAAGRRQYLYHPKWREARDEEKFDRVLELADALPKLREQVRHDLDVRGVPRRRAEAVAISLIDRGLFRVGGESYAEENGTHGVATLLRSHVHLSGDRLTFDYIAKGGARRQVEIEDAGLARAVRALRRVKSGSDRLLVYRDGDEIRELHADDINARIQEIIGCDCTAKDFRTWHATVLAAAAFAREEPAESDREFKKTEKRVVEEVANALGNTPTVARSSYVDPRVTEAFREGKTIERALKRAARQETFDEQQAVVEKSVAALVHKTK